MRGGRSCTIKDEAMAELILKIATKPKAATTGACAPSTIYHFCNPTGRFCVIAAPV